MNSNRRDRYFTSKCQCGKSLEYYSLTIFFVSMLTARLRALDTHLIDSADRHPKGQNPLHFLGERLSSVLTELDWIPTAVEMPRNYLASEFLPGYVGLLQ